MENVSTPVQVELKALREDQGCLISEGKEKVLFARFEVVLIWDLAAKFTGTKTFIQHLEDATPSFYRETGQNLRVWVPPAPKLAPVLEISDGGTVEVETA